MNIFISNDGNRKGPYALSQIKTMWDNGVITADTLYCMEGGTEWRPVQELSLGEQPLPRPARNKPRRRGRRLIAVICFLILLFVGIAIYQSHQQDIQLGKAVGQGVREGMADGEKAVIQKKLQDAIEEGFSETLLKDPQSFMDSGIVKSFAGLNLDPKAPSGFTATIARVDSARIIWRDNSAGAVITNTANNISAYLVVYTIHWRDSLDSNHTGYYQFEETIDPNTKKETAFRMLQMK